MEVVKSNIQINNLRSLLKIILKVKTVECNLNLSESHINLILDFYFFGISQDTYENHIKTSESDKNYFKSKATIDNAKTFLKKSNILVKVNQEELKISPDFLPFLTEKKVLLTLNVVCDDK